MALSDKQKKYIYQVIGKSIALVIVFGITICMVKFGNREDTDTGHNQKAYPKNSTVNPLQKGKTTLHTAVANQSIQKVKSLIEKGADPNAQDKDGFTPLHLAVMSNQHEAIEFLISKGADANAKNGEGKTPLDEPCTKQTLSILTLSIQKKLNRNKSFALSKAFLIASLLFMTLCSLYQYFIIIKHDRKGVFLSNRAWHGAFCLGLIILFAAGFLLFLLSFGYGDSIFDPPGNYYISLVLPCLKNFIIFLFVVAVAVLDIIVADLYTPESSSEVTFMNAAILISLVGTSLFVAQISSASSPEYIEGCNTGILVFHLCLGTLLFNPELKPPPNKATDEAT